VASEDARRILSVAAVQPLQTRQESTERVVAVTILQLQARTLTRQIADLKSKLQRTDPVEQAEAYNRTFDELIALEQQHRSLRDRVVGS
jgi:DNA primase